MLRPAILSALVLASLSASVAAQEEPDVRDMVKRGCMQDYMRFCGAAPPTGDGMKALQCLLKNRKVVSPGCQTALLAARDARPNSARTLKNWSSQ